MAATIGGLIQDPDSLGYEIAANTATTTKELAIDTGNLLIKLTRVGNLTADGVTLQCLYSKLKELWLSDTNLTPLAFPVNPITNEQFELINGWNFDKAVNPTTKIVLAGCSGSSAASYITTVNNFNTVNAFVGAYVSSAAHITSGTKVTTVSDTQITISSALATAISNEAVTIWGDVDYTYNLIRTGGWAVKANTSATSTEEWMGVISLGSLGSEGLTTTTTLSASVTNSNIITINDATTSIVGSYIFGANIPYGTTIAAITSNTQFILSKTVASAQSGAVITIHPKDQTYYQLGSNLYATPNTSITPGQMNQPVQIYKSGTGSFDYRFTSNVFSVYTREQGYTFYQASKTDIGFTTLTYQTYRFPLTSVLDTNIIDNDSTISSNGTTATGSPFNNMRLTWYASPQARIINGTTRYFNVIIDANTASTTTYSTATAQQIYEFVQWTLRRPYTVDIDAGPIGRNGSVTRGLLSYSGSTLNTIYDGSDGGVYIDHFKLTDINNLAFADNTKAIRTYNYVSTGTLTFNTNLSNDADNATYRMFFKQINQGNIISTGYSISGSLAFGTRNAVLVKGSSIDLSGDSSYEIKGNLSGGLTSVSWDFLYENNLQAAWLPNNRYYVGDEYCVYTGTSWAWYRVTSVPVGYTYYTSGSTWGAGNDTSYSTLITNSLGLPAGPTVYLVSVGRSNGQYFVSDPYTIQKSTVNSIASTPIQEKNYGT